MWKRTKKEMFMKKNAKLLLTALMAVLLLSLTGCKATSESLLKSMSAKTSSAKSTSMNMVMDGVIGMSVMGTDLDVTMKMDMDIDMTLDPIVAYAKGKVEVNAMGQDQTVDMQLYENQESDKMVAYVSQDGTAWSKTEIDMPETSADKLGLQKIASFSSAFELEEKTETVNDEECYVLKGNVDGETLQTIMNSMVGTMGSAGELMESIEWDKQEIPLVIKLSKKTEYPVQINIDMTGIMEAAMGKDTEGATCDKFDFIMTFKSFNKTDAIEIPQDVIDNAAEMGSGSSDTSDAATEDQDELSDIIEGSEQEK